MMDEAFNRIDNGIRQGITILMTASPMADIGIPINSKTMV